MSGHMGPTSPLQLARTSNSPETCWNIFPLGLPFSYIYWQEHGWPSNEIHLETFVTFEPWLWVGDVCSNLTTLYDVVTRLSQQVANMTKNFEEVTKEVEETKKKLNATEEKLKTGEAEGN